METALTLVGLIVFVAALCGMPVYLVQRYVNSLTGQTARWKSRRKILEMWAEEERHPELPVHLRQLQTGLRGLLDIVPRWDSKGSGE